MDSAIIKASDRLLGHHDILGVILWQGDLLFYHNTAPCFDEEQLQALGQVIHGLFSGYESMERNVSGISLLFEDRYLNIKAWKNTEPPLYLATIAQTVEALSLAVETTSRWNAESFIEKTRRASVYSGTLSSPSRLSWSHFLIRIKNRLEQSLGLEEGSTLLMTALETFQAGPTRPLPEDQWLGFAHHVANQIQDPEALMRFNQLHAETGSLEE